MSSTNNYVTTNMKILMAKQLLELFDTNLNAYLPQANRTVVYAAIGQQLPWNDGTEVVPTPMQTPNEIYNYYRKAIAAKKVKYSDAAFVIPRRNWESGTVYRQYDCACNLMDIYMDFYVKNSDDQVFKCLYNNNGDASTEEPMLSISTTSLEEPYFETNDGYKWKYMYTISSTQKQKFMTEDWMPVLTNKFVKSAAVSGGIDIVKITNAGNNYTSGSLQDIITIDGDGTGGVLKANVSVGTRYLSGTANVSNLSISVSGTGTYFLANTYVGDNLTINGENKTVISITSNTSMSVDSVFDESANNVLLSKSGGQVVDIIIQNRGSGYTYANVAITDVSGGIGSGASAVVNVGPQDGHGYDPVYELYAKTLMITVDIDRDELGLFPTDNDFRQVFLIQNPYQYGTTSLCFDNIYTLYTQVKVSPGIGDYSLDEKVYQGDTYENASYTADVISFDGVSNILYLNNIRGTLATNQILKGLLSGSTRVAVSKTNPTMQPYSGKVLYVSDREKTQRDPDQTDKIRFLLSL